MKSKEEILKECPNNDEFWYRRKEVLEAMESYAQQKALQLIDEFEGEKYLQPSRVEHYHNNSAISDAIQKIKTIFELP